MIKKTGGRTTAEYSHVVRLRHPAGITFRGRQSPHFTINAYYREEDQMLGSVWSVICIPVGRIQPRSVPGGPEMDGIVIIKNCLLKQNNNGLKSIPVLFQLHSTFIWSCSPPRSTGWPHIRLEHYSHRSVCP